MKCESPFFWDILYYRQTEVLVYKVQSLEPIQSWSTVGIDLEAIFNFNNCELILKASRR